MAKQTHSYTFADYLSWDEGERWEIIDEAPYMQSAPSRFHQEILIGLARQLSGQLF